MFPPAGVAIPDKIFRPSAGKKHEAFQSWSRICLPEVTGRQGGIPILFTAAVSQGVYFTDFKRYIRHDCPVAWFCFNIATIVPIRSLNRVFLGYSCFDLEENWYHGCCKALPEPSTAWFLSAPLWEQGNRKVP